MTIEITEIRRKHESMPIKLHSFYAPAGDPLHVVIVTALTEKRITYRYILPLGISVCTNIEVFEMDFARLDDELCRKKAIEEIHAEMLNPVGPCRNLIWYRQEMHDILSALVSS